MYDIRGIIDDTLRVEDAYNIGLAFARVMRNEGYNKASVGYDGRLHSPKLQTQLIAGLLKGGVDVIDIGCGPSPLLYFSCYQLDVDAGIMITGSHNPPEYNGFKMMLGKKPFFADDITTLAKIIEHEDFGDLANINAGKVTSIDIRESYVDTIINDLIISDELKVVWDTGNGATGEVLEQAVKKLHTKGKGQHTIINGKIDGTFPAHHPDPTIPQYLEQLITTVKSAKADLGIAFDGDGDRIGVVSGSGNIIWGDQLLMLLAEGIITNFNDGFANIASIDTKKPIIIADVKASQLLFDYVNKIGGEPMICATGHSLIKAKMQETGAVLAGEMSGHIFFADRYFGYDDALYAGLRLLEVITSRQQQQQQGGNVLDQFLYSLPSVVNTPEIRISCSEEQKFAMVADLISQVKADGLNINDIDGVRVSDEHGWWLVRASNTQAVLVARCEGYTHRDLMILKATVQKYLQHIGIEQQALDQAFAE
jgi:phosphomannomutase